MADLFGATVDDVRALLPHRTIDVHTRPSLEAVGRFLTGSSARVAARIGTPGTVTATLEAAARNVVAHMAAAMAEDAAFPERAAVADTDYGNVLWTRATLLLGELLTAAGVDPTEPGGGLTATGAAASFPAPLWARSVGF